MTTRKSTAWVEYEEAVATLEKYEKALPAARAECEEALVDARIEYEKAMATEDAWQGGPHGPAEYAAWDKYEEAKDDALDKYEEAVAAALAEYEKALAALAASAKIHMKAGRVKRKGPEGL